MDEDEVKKNFIKSGPIDGEWEEEVPVGTRPFQEAFDEGELSVEARRIRANQCPRIDLVCRTVNGTWLVEVKGTLLKDSPSALGQILIYERAFRDDHPEDVPVRKGLALGPMEDGMWDDIPAAKLDPRDHRLELLEGVCIRNGIQLWVQGRDF